MANAVSEGTPARVRPSERPASVTPMPPGTGRSPAKSETTELMRMSVLRATG